MFFTQLLHVPQAALSAYGLYMSYIAITNLREYEEKSEKAAEWSNTAAEQLHKTRTTQASAAISILFSFSSAVLLAAAPNEIPSILRQVLGPIVLVATLFSKAHVGGFWKSKAKVPFVDGYNEAISKTKTILQILEWLQYSWAGTTLIGSLIGY